jgi:hypothetical protein
VLHLAEIQQFERVDDSLTRRKQVQIGTGNSPDTVFDFCFAEKVIRHPGAAVDLEEVVDDRPAKVAIDKQCGIALEL